MNFLTLVRAGLTFEIITLILNFFFQTLTWFVKNYIYFQLVWVINIVLIHVWWAKNDAPKDGPKWSTSLAGSAVWKPFGAKGFGLLFAKCGLNKS